MPLAAKRKNLLRPRPRLLHLLRPRLLHPLRLRLLRLLRPRLLMLPNRLTLRRLKRRKTALPLLPPLPLLLLLPPLRLALQMPPKLLLAVQWTRPWTKARKWSRTLPKMQ